MVKYTESTTEMGNKIIIAEYENKIYYIPCSEDNVDYQAYLKWLEENK